jgi:hypothetical protein
MKIGKPKYSEKACPSATLSATIPTWLDPGLNSGRHHGKPMTDHLSYGVALVGGLGLPVGLQCNRAMDVIVVSCSGYTECNQYSGCEQMVVLIGTLHVSIVLHLKVQNFNVVYKKNWSNYARDAIHRYGSLSSVVLSVLCLLMLMYRFKPFNGKSLVPETDVAMALLNHTNLNILSFLPLLFAVVERSFGITVICTHTWYGRISLSTKVGCCLLMTYVKLVMKSNL